jgi:hypothetical protein
MLHVSCFKNSRQSERKRSPKIMRKGRLIEKLEEAGIIDHNLPAGAKNKTKGLLNLGFKNKNLE